MGNATTWVNPRHVLTVAIVDDPEAANPDEVLVVAQLTDGSDVYLARFGNRTEAERQLQQALDEIGNGPPVKAIGR
jgi:hypothetical protein